MSNTRVSAAATDARRGALRLLATSILSISSLLISSLAISVTAGAFPARAATPGKTYFFATREACVASGAFGARECVAAFVNARLQLHDRAPRFATASECRLKFHLCEASRAEAQEGAMAYAETNDAVIFTPIALGVEMIASARGAEAAPTLAIDTRARLFPYHPVSRPYEARRDEQRRLGSAYENPAILSADRFEPFSRRKAIGAVTTFTASALGALQGATHETDLTETPEQRRARLKAAPFIQ